MYTSSFTHSFGLQQQFARKENHLYGSSGDMNAGLAATASDASVPSTTVV